jgi:hypothetical protein
MRAEERCEEGTKKRGGGNVDRIKTIWRIER